MAVVSIKNKLRTGNLLVGNPFYDPNAFESIATLTVGSGGASNVEFTSIPNTYSHLQIRATLFGTASAAGINMQFNGDTASNYSAHYMYGTGSAAASGNDNNNYLYLSFYPTTNPNVSVCDILDYTNTNKYKTMRSLGGWDSNGSGQMWMFSGSWRSTSVLSSIKIYPYSGTFSNYSHFALYGIKSS